MITLEAIWDSASNGEEFQTEAACRRYFTVASIQFMWPNDDVPTQDELDRLANEAIRQGYMMASDITYVAVAFNNDGHETDECGHQHTSLLEAQFCLIRCQCWSEDGKVRGSTYFSSGIRHGDGTALTSEEGDRLEEFDRLRSQGKTWAEIRKWHKANPVEK